MINSNKLSINAIPLINLDVQVPLDLSDLAASFDEAWDMTTATKMYTDVGKTTNPEDGDGVLVVESETGGTDLPFTGSQTHTPIPGARDSKPSYFNEFYRGVHLSNNDSQQFFINNLFSPGIENFTVGLVHRILPSPPREAWTSGTGALAIELANTGSGFQNLEVYIGGGEITEITGGYPDGVGSNGDQFELMINFITKSGNNWALYRYNGLVRETIATWTTTATGEVLSNFGIGSNGHPQNQIFSYVGISQNILTESEMDDIASTVNSNLDTVGNIKTDMPEVNLTDIFYDRDLQRVRLTMDVLNSSVPHDIALQFFVIDGGGVDLDNTALMTGSNATLTLTDGVNYDDSGDPNVTIVGDNIQWWIPKEGLTELMQRSMQVTVDSSTDVFTVNTTNSLWSGWANNDDVVLVPVSGNEADYPTGLSRQKLYIIKAVGNGTTAGDTFQVTTVQGNASFIVDMSDNGGNLYVIRKSNIGGANTVFYMAGLKCIRQSDSKESIESMVDQGSWESDNID